MTKRGKFDYILLETTGLADPGSYPTETDLTVIDSTNTLILTSYHISFSPGPIATMFWLDKELGSDIFLDGKFTAEVLKSSVNFNLIMMQFAPVFPGIITVIDSKHCMEVCISDYPIIGTLVGLHTNELNNLSYLFFLCSNLKTSQSILMMENPAMLP